MSHDVIASFKEKFHECDKHMQKIVIAKQQLMEVMPLTLAQYLILDNVTLSFIDQLIYRFSKLQDSMGEKIFPMILLVAGEEVKRKTFIDMLNRLEELGVVERVIWLSLRETRNEIAHDYSFNQSEVVNSINQVYDVAEQLLCVYQQVRGYCAQKFPELNLSNHHA
jgi:uncharacterized protein with HEPN domain